MAPSNPRQLSAREKAHAFLADAAEFHLGALPTEQAHPKTARLSELAKSDLPAAIQLFCDVEREAYEQIAPHLEAIEALRDGIRATLASGRRVFLCGCGATGRLSLALEVLWRQQMHEGMRDRVRSFMAGGDYALVRSIENFEDHPDFGAQQLEDAGFRSGDLLIACTEGGETPFVIGATERAAAEAFGRMPFFIYCNPDEILRKTAHRSAHVLDNPRIQKINLSVGPMAITGSTRLQATSVQMFAVGSALFSATGFTQTPPLDHSNFLKLIKDCDFLSLAPLIEAEAKIYQSGETCLHVSRDHAISVLTDLTERSPTFSLPPFENKHLAQNNYSWTYLEVPRTHSAAEAWEAVLLRSPRALQWPDYIERFGISIVNGFDFSEGVETRRLQFVKNKPQHRYELRCGPQHISLKLQNHEVRFPKAPSLLLEHLFMKLILNLTSTLVMGRVGRYEGNVMLWVKSSNNKLIDRSLRYLKGLLDAEGLTPPSYEELTFELFEVLETLHPDEPAVLKTRDRIRDRLKSQ